MVLRVCPTWLHPRGMATWWLPPRTGGSICWIPVWAVVLLPACSRTQALWYAWGGLAADVTVLLAFMQGHQSRVACGAAGTVS